MESFSGATPIPCRCGFDEDDLEFCDKGIVYSDIFRGIQEAVCECDCHNSVAAVIPIKPKVLVCSECRMQTTHKMDCTRGRVVHEDRELVAA